MPILPPVGAGQAGHARSRRRPVAAAGVDHLGLPGREPAAVRHVRPAGRDRGGGARAAGARDGPAQGALPRPVAEHRPASVRRRAGLLLHRRQPPLQRLLARGGGGEILSLEDRLAPSGRSGSAHADLIRVPPGLGRGQAARGSLSRAISARSRSRPAGCSGPSCRSRRGCRRESTTSAPICCATARSSPRCRGPAGRQSRFQRPAGRLGRTHDGPALRLGAIVMALVLGWLGGAVMRRL